MKIAVIGAGIVGITSAYELACDGHEVVVYEASGAAAQGASFAPTGLMACCVPQAFSHPLWPQGRHWARLWTPVGTAQGKHRWLRHLSWFWRWKTLGDEAAAITRLGQTVALVRASQQRLQDICHDEGLEFERSTGCLLVFRSEEQAEQAQAKLAALKALGVPLKILTSAEVHALEPAWAEDVPIAQAAFFPEDEAGNSRQFALALRAKAQELGVHFAFDTPVDITTEGTRAAVRIRSSSDTLHYDHVVVCTGTPPAQVRQACCPQALTVDISGYSFSAMIQEPLNAPRHAIHDVHTGTTLVRTGQRLRISGEFELGGNPATKEQRPLKALYDAMLHTFPGAAKLSSGTQTWKGSMCVSKDGLPYIGATQCAGLWLNVAHGPLGWATACGSARMIADAIGQKNSALDGAPYSPLRA